MKTLLNVISYALLFVVFIIPGDDAGIADIVLWLVIVLCAIFLSREIRIGIKNYYKD